MLNIILVDNQITFRKGLATVLENLSEEVNCYEANNGIEFLDLLKTINADLVFMDIRMPVMDGPQATREAKKMYPDIWIIGFSSYEQDYYSKKMIDAGARGFLSKLGNNSDILSLLIQNVKYRKILNENNKLKN